MREIKERLKLIPELEEEISMSQSGGDRKIFANPVVIAVVSMVVAAGT